jgi:hypothetical protein
MSTSEKLPVHEGTPLGPVAELEVQFTLLQSILIALLAQLALEATTVFFILINSSNQSFAAYICS